jgi:hypothetical protein
MKVEAYLQKTIAAAGWARRARRKLAESFVEADRELENAIKDLDALSGELRIEIASVETIRKG